MARTHAARYDRPTMPADTQTIVDAAEKLGKLITEHPVLQKYADAQKAVASDPETSRLFQQFDAEVAKLSQLEQAGQQMTEAQQMRLQQMQQVIASNLKVKAFTIAQVELTDLLRKVSQAWQKPVAEAQAGQRSGAAAAAAPAPASSKLIY